MTEPDPVATRYRALKKQAPHAILLMQVGPFMQVLDEDAYTMARVAGLQLSQTGDEHEPVILGRFPLSGLDLYVGKLARAGLSCAIARQEHQETRITEMIRIQQDCAL